MSSYDHGPKQGCNYLHCGNPDDWENCPFVQDEKQERKAPECKHEWRQYWVANENTTTGDPVAVPDGYYCIHCRAIEKPTTT